MNCIVVADEKNLRILEGIVGKLSALRLTGTFRDSAAARNYLLKNQNVDLILLDTDNLEINGFDFIGSLNYQTNIIIISSDSKDALKAFEFNVADYLLKPVTLSRFCKAIDKARRYHAVKDPGESGNKEMFIKKGSLLVKLKYKDITYLEALENYVTVNTIDKKYTLHFTMKAMENQLPSGYFIRIHRSFIVNKSLICEIREETLDIAVRGKTTNLPIGKSYKDILLNDINLISR